MSAEEYIKQNVRDSTLRWPVLATTYYKHSTVNNISVDKKLTIMEEKPEDM